jgi:hypothetical protein
VQIDTYGCNLRGIGAIKGLQKKQLPLKAVPAQILSRMKILQKRLSRLSDEELFAKLIFPERP